MRKTMSIEWGCSGKCTAVFPACLPNTKTQPKCATTANSLLAEKTTAFAKPPVLRSIRSYVNSSLRCTFFSYPYLANPFSLSLYVCLYNVYSVIKTNRIFQIARSLYVCLCDVLLFSFYPWLVPLFFLFFFF